MQGASQLTWQVDMAEVQRLVDALRNYIKKPETKQIQAARRHIWVTIATTIMVALLGGLATYVYMLHLSSLFALMMAVCCALLIFDIVYAVRHLSFNIEGWSVICFYIYPQGTPSTWDLLAPLYAVMTLYGQDPEKIKIEEFEPGPYCGKFLDSCITLPLDGSAVKIWRGHIEYDYFIIIEGPRHVRNDILRAIKYYLYDKYNYAEEYNYYVNGYCTESADIGLEMRLCENRDKIPQWIAQGKKINPPKYHAYYSY
jgi:uncharacterized membrane protein